MMHPATWLASWRDIMAALAHANPWLLGVALVLNLVSLAIKGVRWWACIPAPVRPPLGRIVSATFAGAAINNVVIAQGGEAARVMMVSRDNNARVRDIGGAVALERALDAVCYIALLVLAAWTYPAIPLSLMAWRTAASVVLAASGVVLTVVMMLEPRLARAIPAAFALSLVSWALQAVTYYLVAQAAQLGIPLGASIAAELAVGLSFLVRATPGNVGVFQAVYAATLHPFGVAAAHAIAAAMLIQFIQVAPVTAIGLVTSARFTLRRRGPPRGESPGPVSPRELPRSRPGPPQGPMPVSRARAAV